MEKDYCTHLSLNNNIQWLCNTELEAFSSLCIPWYNANTGLFPHVYGYCVACYGWLGQTRRHRDDKVENPLRKGKYICSVRVKEKMAA